jgi:hypothetical protein
MLIGIYQHKISYVRFQVAKCLWNSFNTYFVGQPLKNGSKIQLPSYHIPLITFGNAKL